MEKDYVWRHRDSEWIKANPGKGTMYKHYFNAPPPSLTGIKTEEILAEQKPIILKEISYYGRDTFEEKEKSDAGVYVIVCVPEKYAYVGQSINMGNRMRNHKMIIQGKKPLNGAPSYEKMIEHFIVHGIDAFEFIKHTHMPGVKKRTELMRKEEEVMREFAAKGYMLYNRIISPDALGEYILCPKPFQEISLQAINLLASDTNFVNKLTELIANNVK